MDAGGRRRNERRVLYATCLAHGMTHMYMLVFPALLTPLRHELGLDLGDALQLAFVGYLLYGLGALPAGMITDRWSARWMLVLCLAVSGSGAALAGFATSATSLVVALGLIGLGASIYHPTGMALISRAFSERRGRALGINGMFGNVGLASAPFVTGLLSSLFGWRSAYLLFALVGVLGAIWVATMAIDETLGEHEQAVHLSQAPASTPLRRYFVVLCIAMTLGGLAYRASSLVMPTYFEQNVTFLTPWTENVVDWLGGTGAKTAAATTLTSLVYMVGIVGQMIGGRIADSHELRLSYLTFHIATLLPLAGMVVFIELPLMFAAMLYVLFSLGLQPIENSLVAKLTPPRWRSTAYGLKFILTFGVGSLAVGLVGPIEKQAGLPAVYATIAGLEVVLVTTALSLWVMSRRALLRVANA